MDPIRINTPEEIRGIRVACKLAAETLRRVKDIIRPGISTQEIDDFVRDHTMTNGGIPAPLCYGASPRRGIRGFPKSVCVSVNDVICHGIPSPEVILRSGDIVNVDITTIVNGYHGDTSATFLVDEILMPPELKRLVDTTYKCMMDGISVVAPGRRIREIGKIIEKTASSAGYGNVHDYVGHGTGVEFHMPPQIPHFLSSENRRFISGMVFTVEPMLTLGDPIGYLDLLDGWTVRTLDGCASAQFEHTVLVIESGFEILTI